MQALLQQFATETNAKSQPARRPYARSVFLVRTDRGKITLRSHLDVFGEFNLGHLVDEKLTQADITYSKFQNAEADMHHTC
jgi:hypothetical protein